MIIDFEVQESYRLRAWLFFLVWVGFVGTSVVMLLVGFDRVIFEKLFTHGNQYVFLV